MDGVTHPSPESVVKNSESNPNFSGFTHGFIFTANRTVHRKNSKRRVTAPESPGSIPGSKCLFWWEEVQTGGSNPAPPRADSTGQAVASIGPGYPPSGKRPKTARRKNPETLFRVISSEKMVGRDVRIRRDSGGRQNHRWRNYI